MKKIELKRDVLTRIVELLKGAFGAEGKLELSFVDGTDGTTSLRAVVHGYSMSAYVRTSCAGAGLPGMLHCRLGQFLKVLETSEAETAVLSEADANFTVAVGRSKFRIPKTEDSLLADRANWRSFMDFPTRFQVGPAEDFARVLGSFCRVLQAAPHDILRSIHVAATKEGTKVLGSDGLRLFTVEMPGRCVAVNDAIDATFPARAAEVLSRLQGTEHTLRIGINAGGSLFLAEADMGPVSFQLCGSLLDGRYPSFDGIAKRKIVAEYELRRDALLKEFKDHVGIDGEKLTDALLTFGDETVAIASGTPDHQYASSLDPEAVVSRKSETGKPLAVRIKLNYLVDALNFICVPDKAQVVSLLVGEGPTVWIRQGNLDRKSQDVVLVSVSAAIAEEPAAVPAAA
jgi:hypothetical protein